MTGERYITVETMSSGIAIVWGLMVANPFINTFERFPKLYSPMTELVPFEIFWGLLFTFAGATSIWLWRKEKKQKAALVNAVIFVFFAVLFGIGDPQSQAWAVYGLIGVCNAIHYQGQKWKTKQSLNR
jgi:drug/metabolite transporter superfamily protein YnfA